MRKLIHEEAVIKTAIHFQKNDPVELIHQLEAAGNSKQLETGAFLAAKWLKK